MKRLLLNCLTAGALAVAGNALADVPVNEIMSLQLNPALQDAFAKANTAVTIAGQQFVVIAPATCTQTTCRVVLDYMNTDPKTFVVIHEKESNDKETLHAKVVTVFQQELYQLTYQVPDTRRMALNVVNFKRLYA